MKAEIKDKPLITVKTISRRIFEQVPQRGRMERTAVDLTGCVPLGIVNDYQVLYREEKNEHLFWVHSSNFTTPAAYKGKEALQEMHEWIQTLPQIFLA